LPYKEGDSQFHNCFFLFHQKFPAEHTWFAGLALPMQTWLSASQ